MLEYLEKIIELGLVISDAVSAGLGPGKGGELGEKYCRVPGADSAIFMPLHPSPRDRRGGLGELWKLLRAY